jgi:hypothetical protein
MHRLEHAAQCFRHVLQLPGLEPGIEALATRELTELYTAKLQQPERALPLLARLAERQATTPAGQWAGQLLQELRQQSRDGSAPDGP